MYSQYSEKAMVDHMPRRYDSTVRAEAATQNRERLICAAQGLFVRQGWTTTTMSQVATTAGLARPTVYLHFDTKLDLLIACIDSSLSEIPVRERPDYQAMGTGALAQRVAIAGRWLRSAHQRSAAIQRVLDDAGVSTPEAARARTEMEQRRHEEFANACQLVLGTVPPAAFVDEVWALGSRAMWFKLSERGWSPEEWEVWFVRMILNAVHALDYAGGRVSSP
ncbi:MAG: TetR family transcriptional regulator [Marmoricola sp.]|nr:TetR family transcriptional regulator [Marmoricola sp.]